MRSLGRVDTFVPIDTEAVRPEDVAQAHSWAGEYGFDAILSTDGDTDRPLIGDEAGNWLRGDVVGILCAQSLGAEVVVTSVSSNTAVEKCGAFRQVLRTRIGSPYVIGSMESATSLDSCQHGNDSPLVVGYEANGGFLLGSDVVRNGVVMTALPTRDAVLPMLALLSMARTRGCKLSELGLGCRTGLPQVTAYRAFLRRTAGYCLTICLPNRRPHLNCSPPNLEKWSQLTPPTVFA